ncbi:hypothetical protein, partial [uncultured Parabacteroides sp.]|uniref:hypothetical protein n=1 Tax=uncultured Parabacteroides sp. TaxID=512312 RepID=UPI0026DBBD76
TPLNIIYEKGLKSTEEEAKPPDLLPSALADGKREPAAQGAALSVCSPVNQHLSLFYNLYY